MGQLETEERPASSVSRYRRKMNALGEREREKKEVCAVVECVVGRQSGRIHVAFVKYYCVH